jgi:hypothetical protein
MLIVVGLGGCSRVLVVVRRNPPAVIQVPKVLTQTLNKVFGVLAVEGELLIP